MSRYLCLMFLSATLLVACTPKADKPPITKKDPPAEVAKVDYSHVKSLDSADAAFVGWLKTPYFEGKTLPPFVSKSCSKLSELKPMETKPAKDKKFNILTFKIGQYNNTDI